MDNFVFEADIIVPRLESRRHKFVIGKDEMERLLEKISPMELGVSISMDDLQDLVRKDGQLSNVLVLMGDGDTRDHVLRTISGHAWLNDVPWTITESADEGLGDPRFGKLVRAYMESKDA